MSLTDDTQQWQEPETPTEERASALRQAAEDGRKARAEAETLRRELAFHQAGLAMSAAQVSVLAKAYDGPADPEAVRKWAEETGFAQAAPSNAPNADDLRQISALTAGADSAPPANVLNPDEASTWGHQRWLEFSRSHPQQAEQLKRGNEIVRPPGW